MLSRDRDGLSNQCKCLIPRLRWSTAAHGLGAVSRTLDEPGLKGAAKTLGLDDKTFASCLASAEFAPRVALDQEDGKRAGVGSTPSFFINGVFIGGAQPVAEFEKLIDNEFQSATNQTAAHGARTAL